MTTFGYLFIVELSSGSLHLTIELNVDVGGNGSYDESPESRMMGNSITTIKISIEKLADRFVILNAYHHNNSL